MRRVASTRDRTRTRVGHVTLTWNRERATDQFRTSRELHESR